MPTLALTGIATNRARAFASLIVSNECQRRQTDARGPRLAELVGTVTAAIALFLAIRCARFPHIAAGLPIRFARDRLPPSTVRALRRTAVRALDAKLARNADRPRCAVEKPAAMHRPRPNVRVPVSHGTVFIPAGGLSRHRTIKQALAAGFPTITAWTDTLTNAQQTPAAIYRAAVTAAARCIVAKEHEVTSGSVRDDLVLEAQSAIGEFLGTRLARFPRLASQLLARFADGTLPRPMQYALRRAARTAVRQRKAHRSVTLEFSAQ